VVELHHELRNLLLEGLELRQQVLHHSEIVKKVTTRPVAWQLVGWVLELLVQLILELVHLEVGSCVSVPPSPQLAAQPKRVQQLPEKLDGRGDAAEVVSLVVQIVFRSHHQIEGVQHQTAADHLRNHRLVDVGSDVVDPCLVHLFGHLLLDQSLQNGIGNDDEDRGDYGEHSRLLG
jgi:hypothetical protein